MQERLIEHNIPLTEISQVLAREKAFATAILPPCTYGGRVAPWPHPAPPPLSTSNKPSRPTWPFKKSNPTEIEEPSSEIMIPAPAQASSHQGLRSSRQLRNVTSTFISSSLTFPLAKSLTSTGTSLCLSKPPLVTLASPYQGNDTADWRAGCR